MFAIPEVNNCVPAFIAKLWHMLQDESTNDMICWYDDGSSFVIKDQIRFASELLPMYYKHNNMASFIRQLNMYGFHKLLSVESSSMKNDGNELGFSHPYFLAGQPFLLDKIKRKISNNREIIGNFKGDPKIVNKLLQEVKQLKNRQELFDTKLSSMKNENDALWREHSILRQKHAKQQKIVNKLIQFLVTLVQQTRGMNIKRLPLPLMIRDGGNKSSDQICFISENMLGSPRGPIICEVVDPGDLCIEENKQQHNGQTLLITMKNQDANVVNQQPTLNNVSNNGLSTQGIIQKVSNIPSKVITSSSQLCNKSASEITQKRKYDSAFDEFEELNTPKVTAPFLDEPTVTSEPTFTTVPFFPSELDNECSASSVIDNNVILHEKENDGIFIDTPESDLSAIDIPIANDEIDVLGQLTDPFSKNSKVSSDNIPLSTSDVARNEKRRRTEGSNSSQEMSLVPTEATSNEPSQLNLYLRGEMDNHLELMQSDLDFLKDILKGEGLNLDANTLFELFSDDPVSFNMKSFDEEQNIEDLTGTGSKLVTYPQFLDDADIGKKEDCDLTSSNLLIPETETSVPILDLLNPEDT